MNGEKPGDDARHVATCAYCGTKTALSAKRLDRDKPLKCPKCGAPLKVVPPRAKGRGEPQIKMKRDYGYDFTHRPRADDALDIGSGDVTLTKLILTVIIIFWFSAFFIVALISTC